MKEKESWNPMTHSWVLEGGENGRATPRPGPVGATMLFPTDWRREGSVGAQVVVRWEDEKKRWVV